jgi:chloramphenicol 3-O phosphotransferase
MKTVRRRPRPAGRILVLNGTSSSGKTTLAKRLQALSRSEAFLHISLDAFRDMEPPGYWAPEAERLRQPRVEALCRAINATAATYARAGESVIVDHVLPREAWSWAAQDWAGLPVLFVGVRCSGQELARREHARADRPIGLAASQIGKVHLDRTYDFEIDTTTATADQCAAALYAWLATRPELAA